MADEPAPVNYVAKIKWLVITQSGNEYLINKDEKKYDLFKAYRNIREYDDRTGETMITREDNLKIVLRPDGSSVIEFEDGTRVTKFYVDISDKKAALNVFNQTKSEFKTSNNNEQAFNTLFTKIECSGFATTIFNSKSSECNVLFGDGSIVTCDPTKMHYAISTLSGENLSIYQDGFISFCSRFKSSLIL
jgi:hypothetical protein